MEPALKITNISKKYRYGTREPYYTLRDSLASLAKLPSQIFGNWGNNNTKLEKDEFWALKDISFEVMPGEVLGIIGKNGAGKSTLLKILSKITPPTTGEIKIRGRVASLLEIGTGFSQELTGRENIFLNGAILGMKQREVKDQFDAIVDFAEIDKFLDTPVKFYSSGMYVRLAFAVAAHLQPEILFVDEVLAVGDVSFQKKCINKMGEVSRQGRTVLFISHSMNTVLSLCSRCLLLDKGKIKMDGSTDKVVSEYLEFNKLKKEKNGKGKVTFPADNEKKVQIREISIHNKGSVGEKIFLEFKYEVRKPVEGLHITVIFSSSQHQRFLDTVEADFLPEAYEQKTPGKYKSAIEIPGWLNADIYSLSVVFECGQQTFDKQEGPKFKIVDDKLHTYGIQGRAPIMAPFVWKTEKI